MEKAINFTTKKNGKLLYGENISQIKINKQPQRKTEMYLQLISHRKMCLTLKDIKIGVNKFIE